MPYELTFQTPLYSPPLPQTLGSRLLEDFANALIDGSTAAGNPVYGSELPWAAWLRLNFPQVTSSPFAARHIRLWEWFDALTPGTKPRPRVEIWPRGGAKSSTVELGCVRVGVKLTRRFMLYVSNTQEQADQHVQAIATHFESIGVGRAVNVYGHSKGWRRSQIRTENGFNVAAFGLDAGTRGVKLETFRPDVLVLDDIDDRHDTKETTAKKIATITNTLLPAGSSDCAVLFVQNKIHRDSIAAQLADGRADFLHSREPVTQEPAVVGLQTERRPQDDGTMRYVVTAGTPTWEGQNLATCEAQINEWGYGAFQREAQHEVEERENGLWSMVRDIEPFRVTQAPALSMIGVGVDPTGSSGGDEAGIVAAGIAKFRPVKTPDGLIEFISCDEWHGYVIDDRSRHGTPAQWASSAVTTYNVHKARVLVAEKNFGGDMVESTIGSVPGAPSVELVHHAYGKDIRAEPVHKLYEEARIHHVGEHSLLEKEMCGWKPGSKESPNRLDALVIILTKLLLHPKRPAGRVL